MTVDLTRRQVNLGAAWSVPVVLAAVAAPAAQGSQIPLDPCTPNLLFKPLANGELKGNDGNGFQLVTGDGITVTNLNAGAVSVPVVFWTSAHQDALLVGAADVLLEAKDGNSSSTVVVLEPGQPRTFRVRAAASSAEAHLIVDCSRFIFKAVQR
ncbi:hypothetical protein [Phycicoccus sp. 3266]|uniref:hypothetical protein n=1 Tax=Phycicoccus sp. 3266 TaxID=2817751 RepID=UPI0028647A5C|nr:hypothetical protein [Phycicoccus sp. 3266]MDR6861930.1 hypothetical protein [Phycicoccus sp. 3266]